MWCLTWPGHPGHSFIHLWFGRSSFLQGHWISAPQNLFPSIWSSNPAMQVQQVVSWVFWLCDVGVSFVSGYDRTLGTPSHPSPGSKASTPNMVMLCINLSIPHPVQTISYKLHSKSHVSRFYRKPWPKHQAMTTAGWPQEWTNRDAPCSCCEDVHENYVPLCCLPWNFLSSKNHFRRQCTLDATLVIVKGSLQKLLRCGLSKNGVK